jgi:hypothetical protein
MNKITLFTFLFISYSFTVLNQNPLFHYPLNGNAIDSGLLKNNGKLVGYCEVAPDRFGNPCGAIYLDGQTAYIEAPHVNQFNKIKKQLTVTAWIKLDKKNRINDLLWATILCKGNSSIETPENPHFRLQNMQSKKQSTVSINTKFTEFDLNYQNHQFKENEWMFLALVYDGKIVKYYIDGQNVFSYPYSGKLNKNESPLHIGLDIPGAKEYFKGTIDDIRIYHKALSDDLLFKIYNQVENVTKDNALTMQCPKDIEITSKQSCEAYINYSTPTLIYPCNQVELKQTSGPPNNSFLSVGTQMVTFISSYPNGKNKTCTFNITIKDTIAPVFNNKSDSVIIIAPNQKNTIIKYAEPIADDNCKIKSLKKIQGPDNFSNVTEGKYKITYQATDFSNNISTISWNILVKSIQSQSTVLTDLIVIQDSINLKTDSILTIAIYDNGKEDNDTISIYFNNDLIIDKKMIKNKKNGVIIIHINPIINIDNLIVSKAWNLGSVSPNTLKMEIYEGYFTNYNLKENNKLLYNKILHSFPGKAGSIKLSLV